MMIYHLIKKRKFLNSANSIVKKINGDILPKEKYILDINLIDY